MSLAIASRWRSVMTSLEPERAAQRQHQQQHHREARVDRADDEVRREDRRVPAGQLRDGEVEAHDAVHRDDERRRQSGEQHVRDAIVPPLAARARASRARRRRRCAGAARRSRGRAPSARSGTSPRYQNSSDTVKYVVTAATSHGSELLKFGHTPIVAGIRDEPVEEPRPAEMQERKQRRVDQREERHRLGEAVDRRAPVAD